ncbi:glyoxalase [Nocardia sp. NPDC052566]|uniref:glyoxalase n=1 Tax=Nocardia sp. NPDC052566 TaxID=3364330 RepID=UPI0037CB1635
MTTVDGAPYSAQPTNTFGLGLHHVQLAIPPGSEAECRKFYVDIIGMTELRKPPDLAGRGGLWLRADSLEIHLGVEADFRPARKAHPGILVEDLEGLASWLSECGVDVEWDAKFPGFRRCYAFDHVGNRLEFMCRDSADQNWE